MDDLQNESDNKCDGGGSFYGSGVVINSLDLLHSIRNFNDYSMFAVEMGSKTIKTVVTSLLAVFLLTIVLE
jgi:hypothetical protein